MKRIYHYVIHSVFVLLSLILLALGLYFIIVSTISDLPQVKSAYRSYFVYTLLTLFVELGIGFSFGPTFGYIYKLYRCNKQKLTLETDDASYPLLNFFEEAFSNNKIQLSGTKFSLPAGWYSVKLPKDSMTIATEVQNIFYDTWQYDERLGRDAVNLDHTGVKITAVCLVHNLHLFDIYCKTVSTLKNKHNSHPANKPVKQIKDIKTLQSELGSALTSFDENIPKICADLNEVYLFHGTAKHNVQEIIEDGFNLQYARDGLYGKALYLAESSEKSDQYSDRKSGRKDQNLCVVITRTALSHTYFHRNSKKELKIHNLPCTEHKCYTPRCGIHKQKFDSVVAGFNNRFREFLIYDTKQCYPHVLVFYDRIKEGINTEEGHLKNNNEIEKREMGTDPPYYLIGPKSEIKRFGKLKKNAPKIQVENESKPVEVTAEIINEVDEETNLDEQTMENLLAEISNKELTISCTVESGQI